MRFIPTAIFGPIRRKLTGFDPSRRVMAVFFVALFVGVGLYLLQTSHAATSSVSIEPENGSLSGAASKVNDSAASGGNSVQFGDAAGGGDGGGTSATLHYTANVQGDFAGAMALGFNVMDTGPTKAIIDALPSGAQALVWLGNMDNAPLGSNCPAPALSDSQFQADVDALANDSKVFGFYISDEPHPVVCPNAASDLKARADYIHQHAPGKKVFIIVLDGYNVCNGNYGCEYAALQPSKTHIDLFGLDPYPCHFDSGGNAVPCETSKISQDVDNAVANGIPKSDIVPVFQTFGQENRQDGGTAYYRTPSTTEMTEMLNLWDSLVPNPVMDYSYTYGIQCDSSHCVASQALVNHPELRTIISAHNKK